MKHPPLFLYEKAYSFFIFKTKQYEGKAIYPIAFYLLKWYNILKNIFEVNTKEKVRPKRVYE